MYYVCCLFVVYVVDFRVVGFWYVSWLWLFVWRWVVMVICGYFVWGWLVWGFTSCLGFDCCYLLLLLYLCFNIWVWCLLVWFSFMFCWLRYVGVYLRWLLVWLFNSVVCDFICRQLISLVVSCLELMGFYLFGLWYCCLLGIVWCLFNCYLMFLGGLWVVFVVGFCFAYFFVDLFVVCSSAWWVLLWIVCLFSCSVYVDDWFALVCCC